MKTVHLIRKIIVGSICLIYMFMSIASAVAGVVFFFDPTAKASNIWWNAIICLGIPGSVVVYAVALIAIVGILIELLYWLFTGKCRLW